ncbi:MAG: 50S ribosome-binding GTPase [Planctomycetota bacterium]|nr:50S ribosome-binding GTPase [Planctomycetota bacterium]
MNLEDTIVAVSSPPGSAVRGIIRLSGARAFEIAEGVFAASDGRRLPDCGGGLHLDGTLRIADAGLPASVALFRRPRSYTGQDIVEIHLLGAPGVVGLTMESLLGGGARRAEAGEFTARAYLAGMMDIAQVHGVAAMIAARSDGQLQAAENLLHGALSRAANGAREELADLLSLVEGALDFADEPIEFITPDQLRERLGSVRESLQGAADAGLRAERWGRLPRVVLTGAPNAGKSSLFNRLTGMDRAICTPVAGTTRDVLSAPLQLRHSECLLIDAAGTGEATSDVEARAQDAARRESANADLLIEVYDASRGRPSGRGGLSAASSLCVANKSDLLASGGLAELREWAGNSSSDTICVTSALTGEGCERLRRMIEDGLGDRPMDRNDATIALMAEHREGLQGAIAAVEGAIAIASASGDSLENADLVALELRTAADALGLLVGQDLADDLLGRIFARFCVGK